MIRLRWFNFDVSRDRKNNPITVVDRILEIAAAMMAVGILILTAVLYTQAPDTVPSHFNAMGEADDWSDKSIYWFMAVVFMPTMNTTAIIHLLVYGSGIHCGHDCLCYGCL